MTDRTCAPLQATVVAGIFLVLQVELLFVVEGFAQPALERDVAEVGAVLDGERSPASPQQPRYSLQLNHNKECLPYNV